MLTYLLHTNTDWVQLVARVTLGIVFFAHGAQKMFGWFKGPGLKITIKTLNEHMHIPVAFVFLAIAAEFLGGVGLIVGLLSRVAAAGIALIMAVAIVLVHGRHGLFLNNPAVTGAIVGVRTAKQVRGIVGAASLRLNDAEATEMAHGLARAAA